MTQYVGHLGQFFVYTHKEDVLTEAKFSTSFLTWPPSILSTIKKRVLKFDYITTLSVLPFSISKYMYNNNIIT